MYKKSYRPKLRKFGKRVFKKYVSPFVNKKTGHRNRMKLYKEIGAIKRMLNVEKKTKDGSINAQTVGQLYNSADGVFCTNLLPTISQGTGFDQREGRSIKLTGLYLRGKFQQQANTSNVLRLNMIIFKLKQGTNTTAAVLPKMFNPDSLTGVRDYYCPRNPDSYKEFVIIKSKNIVIQPDNIAGQSGITNFILPIKLNHHVRYDANSNTIVSGDIFIIIRGDSGDCGTPSTGALFNLSTRFTYVDN